MIDGDDEGGRGVLLWAHGPSGKLLCERCVRRRKGRGNNQFRLDRLDVLPLDDEQDEEPLLRVPSSLGALRFSTLSSLLSRDHWGMPCCLLCSARISPVVVKTK